MYVKRRQPRHRKPSTRPAITGRLAVRATSVAAGTALATGMLSPSAFAASGPDTSLDTNRIEGFAKYTPQRWCDPGAKAGTVAFASLALAYYQTGYSGGISRGCGVGGLSEHKEGRAWDWMLNANDPAQRAVADEFVTWLTERGPDGELGYNARRLGVMYIIWNKEIWGSYLAEEGWRDYYGSNPHTDHVHVSLTWAGAMKDTSWWTGKAAGGGSGGWDDGDDEEDD